MFYYFYLLTSITLVINFLLLVICSFKMYRIRNARTMDKLDRYSYNDYLEREKLVFYSKFSIKLITNSKSTQQIHSLTWIVPCCWFNLDFRSCLLDIPNSLKLELYYRVFGILSGNFDFHILHFQSKNFWNCEKKVKLVKVLLFILFIKFILQMVWTLHQRRKNW